MRHQTPKVFANCIKRRRRSLISAQGCHNPGSEGKRDINAEGVGEMRRPCQRFQRFNPILWLNPGLYQPWAEISERLRRLRKAIGVSERPSAFERTSEL